MAHEVELHRRGFIVLAGAGLILGWAPAARASAPEAAAFTQTFLRIDTDGTVTVLAKHLDMGQGVWSGLASIVAEELDADWSQMKVEGAPAAPEYKNLVLGAQVTGGSTSIANSWTQLRTAGATARAMLIAAAAQRWKVPASAIVIKKGVVRDASGHQAGFGELAAAAAALPVPTEVKLKDPKDFVFLGKGFQRLDTAAKARGTALFGIDVRLPGMKIAVLARSPRFGGKLKTFDAAETRQVAGVTEVVQTPQGVAVIADNSWAAIKGRTALKLSWDDADAELRSSAAILETYKALAGTRGGMISLQRGDADQAMARAHRIVEADYAFPYLAHAPMETPTAVCRVTDGLCEIWGGIQSQTANQKAAAAILGLPIEKVLIHTLLAGGSFGRRATLDSDWIVELAEIVKATKAAYPVKLLRTREDDITGGYYRPMAYHRLRAGLTSGGEISGLTQTLVTQSILYGYPFGAEAPPKSDPTATEGNLVDRYDVDDATLRWIPGQAHVPITLYRSVGNTHTTFAKEVFMDELARAAGRDPLAFRLAHLGSRRRQAAVLKLAAEKFGWGGKPAPGRAWGMAVQEAFNTHVAQMVEVSVAGGEFRVERVVCAVDCGFALNPDNVAAQMEGGVGFGLSAALHGEITLSGGIPDQTNFDTYPILRMSETPRGIETYILNSGAPPTGVGEPGATPIAAAVANALSAATGTAFHQLPLKFPAA